MVNIGIISDTHDDIVNLKSAIKIFNERKVSYVIHAGDYIFPGVVKEFRNFNGKLIGVLGNNDGEILGLMKNFQEIYFFLKKENLSSIGRKNISIC